MFDSTDNSKLICRICEWHVFERRKLWPEYIHTCLLLIRWGYCILVLYKIIYALSGELFVCSWKDYFGVYYPCYAPTRKINIKITLEWLTLCINIYVSFLWEISLYFRSYHSSLKGRSTSLGQPGAHLGPVGPEWAPCWPHKLVIRRAHRSLNCLNVKHGEM